MSIFAQLSVRECSARFHGEIRDLKMDIILGPLKQRGKHKAVSINLKKLDDTIFRLCQSGFFHFLDLHMQGEKKLPICLIVPFVAAYPWRVSSSATLSRTLNCTRKHPLLIFVSKVLN